MPPTFHFMADKKKTVAMFGPSFDGSGDIVNREVPEGDVPAYRNAGYEVGSVAEKPVEKPVVSKGKSK